MLFFQKLSSPLTADEGSAFLAILQDIQTQFIALMDVYGARILAFEILPGLNAWGLPTIQGLFDVSCIYFYATDQNETNKTALDTSLYRGRSGKIYSSPLQ